MKKIVVSMAIAMLTSVMLCAQNNERIPAVGLGITQANGHFERVEFSRRPVGDDDVLIEILYSAVCHSDVHAVTDLFGGGMYPLIPGHEMVGRVTQVGKNVTKFKVGDYAGVGPMIDSCGECENCLAGYEQECLKRTTWTYGGVDFRHDNDPLQGGYSTCIVAPAHHAVRIPSNADLSRIAPMLCGGITVYSPIIFSNVQKGQKVGVAGFGGLGNMAVKFLQDIGTYITVFDVNESKRAVAQEMGINFVNVNNQAEMAGQGGFDFIISTIPTGYNPMTYLFMLKRGGQMAIVGQPREEASLSAAMLPFANHRLVYGSLIGGIKQTEEMIEYAVSRNIYPDVQLIPTTGAALDEVFEKLHTSTGEFRYVMDMKSLK